MKEKNILLCDPDHRWMQNSFNALTSAGHNVHIASNGKFAQTELAKDEIDVLIIDLDTQSHSAVEVIKYIKSKEIVSGNFAIDHKKNIKHQIKLRHFSLTSQKFLNVLFLERNQKE